MCMMLDPAIHRLLPKLLQSGSEGRKMLGGCRHRTSVTVAVAGVANGGLWKESVDNGVRSMMPR